MCPFAGCRNRLGLHSKKGRHEQSVILPSLHTKRGAMNNLLFYHHYTQKGAP